MLQRKRLGWFAALGAMGLAAGCQVSPTLLPGAPAQAPSAHAGYHVAGTTSTRYLVTFTGSSAPAGFADTVKSLGGSLESSLDGSGIAIVTSGSATFATNLAKQSGVESVAASLGRQLDTNAYAQGFDPALDAPDATGASGEPLSGYQWGLNSIQAPAVWKRRITGKGVRVAVLDTGVDDQNKDLTPNLDRTRSKSFVAAEPSYVDFNGHGSHVSGIIAAANNGYGVTGVAPNASFFAVKVLDRTGYGEDADILKGIVYAADHGARIINMSLGGPSETKDQTKAYRHAVAYARDHGALVVAAVGNDGSSAKDLGFLLPAELDAAIGVSAVGPQNQQNFDTFALYSNYGRRLVDISAPGGNIIGFDPVTYAPQYNKRDFVLSTWSTQADTYSENGMDFHPATHMFLAGTSMATPHVTGTLALMFQAHPELSPADAKKRLLKSSDDLGKPGPDQYYGAGRVNAYNAVF